MQIKEEKNTILLPAEIHFLLLHYLSSTINLKNKEGTAERPIRKRSLWEDTAKEVRWTAAPGRRPTSESQQSDNEKSNRIVSSNGN